MTDRPFRIVIPGEPIAQPRATPRIKWPSNAALLAARSVDQLKRIVFTGKPMVPKGHPVHSYRKAVELIARRNWQRSLIPEGVPLRLDLRLVFSRPKAMTRKTKPNPRKWHTVRPDNDNVLKAVKDALSGVIYHDDRQIACESVAKWYAAGDEQPHTEISIRKLT